MIQMPWKEPPARTAQASKIRQVLNERVIRELKVNPMRWALLFAQAKPSIVNQVRKIASEASLEVTTRRVPTEDVSVKLVDIYLRYNPLADERADQ